MDWIQQIYLKLKEHNLEVYLPTQKVGECTSPYVVIKFNGSNRFQGFSSTQQTFELLCYVPQAHYTTLEPYIASVEEHMKELLPLVKPTYYRSPTFYDDSIKAHMVTTTYNTYLQII